MGMKAGPKILSLVVVLINTIYGGKNGTKLVRSLTMELYQNSGLIWNTPCTYVCIFMLLKGKRQGPKVGSLPLI